MSEPQIQSRVNDWMLNCFGPQITADQDERSARFLEEAIELAQACNFPKDRLMQIVEYVYGREPGTPAEETGDVMCSLAALATARKIDMEQQAIVTVAKCVKNTETIRRKRRDKPAFLKGSVS